MWVLWYHLSLNNTNSQQNQKVGVLYAIAAFLFWGLVPIYFKQVVSVTPMEVLIHRIIWSVIVLFILLLIRKRFHLIKPIFNDKNKLKYLFLSSFLVSINWLIFIYAISQNKILEASLGYFINPLISVFLGFVFFSEKITKNQSIAIIIATIAVIIQMVEIGSLPLISIGLATSFAFYGLVRKKINVESMSGLFVETLMLLPFALIYLAYLIINNNSAFINDSRYISFMLSLGGIVTVLPLLWFNIAIINIKLSTVGILQYIGPSVAFIVAILIYNEPLDSNKLFTFILIWIAIIVFSYDLIVKKRSNS